MLRIFLVCLKAVSLEKPLEVVNTECFVEQKLKNYVETSRLKELRNKVDQFLRQKTVHSVHFKLDETSSRPDTIADEKELSQVESVDESIYDDSEDFLEILRLRHSNLSRYSNLYPFFL